MTLTPAEPDSDVTIVVPRPLADALSQPGVAQSLASVISHADLLALLVESLDGFLERSEVIGDSLLDGFNELQQTIGGNNLLAESDVSLVELGRSAADLARTLPATAPDLVALINSGVLSEMAPLARAVTEGSEEHKSNPVEVKGPLSLVKALKDPDVARAASWLLTVARSLGRELPH